MQTGKINIKKPLYSYIYIYICLLNYEFFPVVIFYKNRDLTKKSDDQNLAYYPKQNHTSTSDANSLKQSFSS